MQQQYVNTGISVAQHYKGLSPAPHIYPRFMRRLLLRDQPDGGSPARSFWHPHLLNHLSSEEELDGARGSSGLFTVSVLKNVTSLLLRARPLARINHTASPNHSRALKYRGRHGGFIDHYSLCHSQVPPLLRRLIVITELTS